MKLIVSILAIGISFLQISVLFAEECNSYNVEQDCAQYWYCEWEDTVCIDKEWNILIYTNNQPDSVISNDSNLKLGMCSECSDDFNYGEDESNPPTPPTAAYIDLHFFHPDWYDDSGEFYFTSDIKSGDQCPF